MTVSRESPTQLARHLLRRHNQLALPDSPSQGSTPAELVDEEVSKLSDQVVLENTMPCTNGVCHVSCTLTPHSLLCSVPYLKVTIINGYNI